MAAFSDKREKAFTTDHCLRDNTQSFQAGSGISLSEWTFSLSECHCLISHTGRLRWKIENEGFNTQKNHGYALQHKYARISWRAAKNYYQCLQIGHLINQLMILSTTFQSHLEGKMTCRHLWQAMIAFLLYGYLSRTTLEKLAQRRCQIRLV